MLKWFKDCKSIEDVKKTYKKLAVKYHPDIHGDSTTKIMAEINNEYEIAFKRFKNIHSDSKKAEGKETANNAESSYNASETPEMFKNIIDSSINCDGVQIDIVGSWVWLTGNTFAHKEIIKSLGFKWANKKKAWYWYSGEWSGKKSHMSLDEIKDKYGCQSFTGHGNLQLQG